jgi:hypothetical protein
VSNVRNASSRLLLLLPSGLALRRLASCRLFCRRRASAALVTLFDAMFTPLSTPLHAGGLRLGGCVSKGEARCSRYSRKGKILRRETNFASTSEVMFNLLDFGGW